MTTELTSISLVERQRCAIEFWNPTNLPSSLWRPMQWDELLFSRGGSAFETEKRTWNINLVAAGLAQRLFHYPPEAWGKLSAEPFREAGGAL
jgi:hypothetical protein